MNDGELSDVGDVNLLVQVRRRRHFFRPGPSEIWTMSSRLLEYLEWCQSDRNKQHRGPLHQYLWSRIKARDPELETDEALHRHVFFTFDPNPPRRSKMSRVRRRP